MAQLLDFFIFIFSNEFPVFTRVKISVWIYWPIVWFIIVYPPDKSWLTLPPVSQAKFEGGGGAFGPPSNSITFSNFVGGKEPPSRDLELTLERHFLFFPDRPDEDDSKSDKQDKFDKLPPFLLDSDTFFFFFFPVLSWWWRCLRKLMSHCSSPLEFSSAFSKSSWNSCQLLIFDSVLSFLD